MSTKKNGGPAFPCSPENSVRMDGSGGPGMTLRDYFAAKAMQALLSNPEALAMAIDAHADQNQDREGIMSIMAFLVADAMIAARGEA